MLRPGLALALLVLPGLAQAPASRSAWVLAADDKGQPVADLAATDWKVTVGGKAVELKQVETPAQTGQMLQTWALVFEPIRDPAYRMGAFQAAAQFLVNLPDGDRVLIAARTKEGLVPLTPGLSVDRLAWAKALEALPEKLCADFEGTPGARAAALEALAVPAAAAPQQEAFVAALRTFLGGLPKAVQGSAYGKPEAKGVRPIDRLGLDAPTTVRARLSVVTAEMKSLTALLEALGKLPAPAHCLVFSRNDADDFTHPSVRTAMGGSAAAVGGSSGAFARTKGDDGGPKEAAELAFREMTLAQEHVRQAALRNGVTLYSVAGSGGPFLGNLGATAEATGGLALGFDSGMPARLGQALQAFGSRYRLTWVEGADAAASPQPVVISTRRSGVKVSAPRER